VVRDGAARGTGGRIAVLLTLAATLFASWAWGFTLNRVSLFALIFSIGILVDDAIVVVENIHRRRALAPHQSLAEIIPEAVDEVGSPTILATFTVIAALLPMAFGQRPDGAVHEPDPINASMGMLISLRWHSSSHPGWRCVLPGRIMCRPSCSTNGQAQCGDQPLLQRPFEPVPERRAWQTGAPQAVAGDPCRPAAAVALGAVKLVILKMLPFDNKSNSRWWWTCQRTALEQTSAVLHEIGGYLATVPEVTDYQAYAGTASPINFNGLVRQYYCAAPPRRATSRSIARQA